MGKDGVSASKNWKDEPSSSSVVERMYTEKKIDTQKVYRRQTSVPTMRISSGNWGWEAPPQKKAKKSPEKKRTAPSVPEWSPTSVLTGPDQA